MEAPCRIRPWSPDAALHDRERPSGGWPLARSADRDRLSRRPAERAPHHGAVGSELLREQSRVQARLASLDAMPIPTYVLHGGGDPTVPVWANEPLESK